jgi:hypothetical protein
MICCVVVCWRLLRSAAFLLCGAVVPLLPLLLWLLLKFMFLFSFSAETG